MFIFILTFVLLEGFMKLAQMLINLGAECGKIDLSKVMPSRKALKSKIISMGQKVISETAAVIERPVELRRISFTTDMYHNKLTSVDYMDLSASWIEENFIMRRQTLFCKVNIF